LVLTGAPVVDIAGAVPIDDVGGWPVVDVAGAVPVVVNVRGSVNEGLLDDVACRRGGAASSTGCRNAVGAPRQGGPASTRWGRIVNMGGVALVDVGGVSPHQRGWGGPRRRGRGGPWSTWVGWPLVDAGGWTVWPSST
jgi:hypothetical protein